MVDIKTTHLKRASLLLFCIALLTGCVEQGRPLVTDRSPVFTASNPSVVPDGQATRPRVVREEPTVVKSRVPVERARVRIPAPAQYLVRPGDTLYSIAWRFELNHVGVARLNNIRPPYVIHPGQVLALRAVNSAPATTVIESGPATRPTPRPSVRPPVASNTAPATKRQPATPARPTPQPTALPQPGRWIWPVAGKPHRSYSASNKGVDFLLTDNKAGIRACNAGEVVYAGNGIGGFEQLVIVRHADDLLSAYSFNGTTRVAEQQLIKAGQKVADISNTGRGSQKLHFELRKHGKPINPGTIIR